MQVLQKPVQLLERVENSKVPVWDLWGGWHFSTAPALNEIHVLAALSRHPCRSTHSAPPAFSLHPSRVLWRLNVLGMKIKGKSMSTSRNIRLTPSL